MDVSIEHLYINNQEIIRVRWYDTIKERAMTASEIKREWNLFSFRRIDQEGGRTYYFVPINLDIYNSKVKQHLVAGKEFQNDEDLINAFLSLKANN